MALIFETLRAEVRARRQLVGDGGKERSALERQLQRCAEQLEITRVVSAHWPLDGRTPVERVLVLIHKVVRRCLRWYINPIVEQQNVFNDGAARTLRLLLAAYAEVQAQANVVSRSGNGVVPIDDITLLPTIMADDGAPDTSALQELVAQTAHVEPPVAFAELQLLDLPRALSERQEVSAHWELRDTTPLARIKILSQRLLRQYLRWMINPIVEQQNAFNAALTAMIPSVIAADAETRGLLARVRARLNSHI